MNKAEKYSFETLYTEHFQKSFLFVKSYVFDDMVAEDIASECILKAWQNSRKEVIRNMNGYLYSLLKNATLNYLNHYRMKCKKIDKLKVDQLNEIKLRINTLETSFIQEVFTKEIMEIIHQTLSQTSPVSKQIFELSRFQGISNKEIATKMNMSVKNIEYHISKTLKILRVQLQDYLVIIMTLFLFLQ